VPPAAPSAWVSLAETTSIEAGLLSHEFYLKDLLATLPEARGG
jgi:hypothetical protein